MAGAKDTTSIADFEKSLDELEKLVRDREQGELSLEQSLAAFERRVKLTRDCQQALKSAEQRVEQPGQNQDGSLTTRPFNPVEAACCPDPPRLRPPFSRPAAAASTRPWKPALQLMWPRHPGCSKP